MGGLRILGGRGAIVEAKSDPLLKNIGIVMRVYM